MTTKEIIDKIANHLDHQTSNFTIVCGNHVVNVSLDFENGESDGDFGEVFIHMKGQRIEVLVSYIPRDRMGDRMIALFAAKIYAVILAGICHVMDSEALLDALTVTIMRFQYDYKIYPSTASRYYRRAYALSNAPGCDKFLTNAIESHIRDREAKAFELINKAAAIIRDQDIIDGAGNDVGMNLTLATIINVAKGSL